MSQPTPGTEVPHEPGPMFTAPPPERGSFPTGIILGVTVAVLLVLGGLLLLARRHQATPTTAILPPDPASSTLALSDVAMSESTSLSGGKSTFIDGHIRNNGTQTVTGITVQVLFRNDLNLAPQVETLPLQLIRTHEPYVDTQPVQAAPLAPGDQREFRLTFESINDNWNIQIPDIHIVHVTTR